MIEEPATLRVSAAVEVDAEPDYAVVGIEVRSLAELRAEAVVAVETSCARTRDECLPAAGVRGVELAGLQVSSIGGRLGAVGSTANVEWSARALGRIVCDVEHVSDLLQRLAVIPGILVTGVTWGTDPGNPAHTRARHDAVAAVQRSAADYADALGRPPGTLVELSESPVSGIEPDAGPLALPRLTGWGRPEVEVVANAGPSAPRVTVGTSVEATYRI